MKLRLSLLMVLFFVTSNANSSNYSGVIDAIKFGPANGTVVYIRMQGSIPGKPACSTNQYYDFVFDSFQIGGSATFSGLLSAYHAGKTISIEGMNACGTVSNVEDLKQVALDG